MPPGDQLFLGIDVGTSGVRAVAIGEHGGEVASASRRFAPLNIDRRDPLGWWRAVEQVLADLLRQIARDRVAAIAVDGTSGTMVVVDAAGTPLAPAKLYNDRCDDRGVLASIARHAPPDAAVHGATSALARLIAFSGVTGAHHVLHEADWVASHLSGLVGRSDENNSLKTGYDPVTRTWPDWIARTGANPALLPAVQEPGTPFGPVAPEVAASLGLPAGTLVVAGSTDGCASFLATGASELGDGVTVLGSTLTVKLSSDQPIVAPDYGIYSHRIGDLWLAGGASNTGGAVLLPHFTTDQLQALSERIDPDQPTELHYYPLIRPGERFPINDPDLAPRLSPRPHDDARFLQGMLEGIAEVEALAYGRIAELGGPRLRTLRSVGGGAANPVWTRIRQRCLGVPFEASLSSEAATGAALLARRGATLAG